jgi:hypothetical protein
MVVACGWHDAGIHHTQSLYPFHLQPTVHHSLRGQENYLKNFKGI